MKIPTSFHIFPTLETPQVGDYVAHAGRIVYKSDEATDVGRGRALGFVLVLDEPAPVEEWGLRVLVIDGDPFARTFWKKPGQPNEDGRYRKVAALRKSVVVKTTFPLVPTDLINDFISQRRHQGRVWLSAMAVNPDSEVGRTGVTYILHRCSDKTVVPTDLMPGEDPNDRF